MLGLISSLPLLLFTIIFFIKKNSSFCYLSLFYFVTIVVSIIFYENISIISIVTIVIFFISFVIIWSVGKINIKQFEQFNLNQQTLQSFYYFCNFLILAIILLKIFYYSNLRFDLNFIKNFTYI